MLLRAANADARERSNIFVGVLRTEVDENIPQPEKSRGLYDTIQMINQWGSPEEKKKRNRAAYRRRQSPGHKKKVPRDPMRPVSKHVPARSLREPEEITRAHTNKNIEFQKSKKRHG
jgi:hypothetical protein